MKRIIAAAVILVIIIGVGVGYGLHRHNEARKAELATHPTAGLLLDETTEAPKPTEAVGEVHIKLHPDTPSEATPKGSEKQTMLIPGSNGEAVAVTDGMNPEDIADPVAKENYKQILGEQNESVTPEESSMADTEDTPENKETISNEQYGQMEKDIRAYTDKQAHEWEAEVYEKN